MGPTHGSLFAGIGGFDLGLERAGWQCSWQVETDRACNWVLAKHWLDVRRYGDIREIGTGQLEAVDLVCGGFPCQDVSVAGKRKGLAGERSGLWFEFHRLLAELAPKWVVVENVPGLLSSNGGRDFAVILQGLVEIGYGVCWRILDAQYFGVAQRRRRVFIVGSLGDGCAAEVLFESKSSAWDSPPSRQAGTQVADPITKSFAKHHGRSAGKDSYPRNIVMHALSGHNQRNDPDGEHFVVDEVSRPLAFGQTMNHYDAGHQTYIVGALDSGGKKGLRTEPGEHLVAYNWQSGGDVRLSFGKPNLQANQVPAVGVRRLTPTECERLQGFPPTLIWEVAEMTRDEFAIALLASGAVVVKPESGQVFVTRGPGGHRLNEPRAIEGSNCNGYKVASFWLGKIRKQLRLHRLVWIAVHGIIPDGQVIHHINHHKVDNRLGHLESLTSADNSTRAAEEGCYRSGLDNPATKIAPQVARQIADDYRHAQGTMRQLAECYGISKSRVHQIVHEQGWTEGQADSTRYRQLGNAVTVNVAEWIGKRIAKAQSGDEKQS